MPVTLLAAVARNGVIGADGDLAVRISADLRRFKALTMGHTLVMGRRTWDSIGRALPGRRTIVVTRQTGWTAEGAAVAGSVQEALALAGTGEVFVVGGGEIYAQTLDRADALELTEIDASPDGDTYFPDLDRTTWVEVAREVGDGYDFVRYERAGAERTAPVTATT
jgi:dihydrofolate reductase